MSDTRNSFNLVLVYITPTLVGVGVVLNLLTIMVFSRIKMRKYSVSILMISLAVSDTAVLTLSGIWYFMKKSHKDTKY